MRLGLVVSPSDSALGDVASRRDALAWLRPRLARNGFQVVVVGAGGDPVTNIETAVASLSSGDSVLVHVSGRLVGRDSLDFEAAGPLPLWALCDVLASKGPARASFILDLLHEEDPTDPTAASECMAMAVRSLGARERGYAVLAAVRPYVPGVDRIGFTRLVLPQEREDVTPEALLSAMYQRAASAPDPERVAPSFTFVRGFVETSERPIHARIAEAIETRDWRLAVDLRLERVPTLDSAREKVRELIAVARILQVELHDAEGALRALEEARSLDPSRVPVLQALRRGYELQRRWGNALEVIRALGPLASSPDERMSLLVAQARIWSEHLGDDDGAVTHLETALEQYPLRAEILSELARIHHREGRSDAVYLAALALEELDAADVDQQLLIGQLRSVGPVRARSTLDAGAWDSLRARGSDEVLVALFRAVSRAAIALRVDELRSARRLPVLDPNERLGESSTASAGRSFQWAARVLGIPCPDLYVRGDIEGGIAALPAETPATAFGPAVLSGPSAKDLAFLAGRHLTYYLPEYHVLIYYPTREELTKLLFAAVQVSLPQASSEPAVLALRDRITRLLRPQERALLDEAVRKLEARGGRAAVGSWMRSADLTAERAGLLLSGDLATAMAVVRSEARAGAGLPAETRRSELIAFCASSSHAALRTRFLATGPDSDYPAPMHADAGVYAST